MAKKKTKQPSPAGFLVPSAPLSLLAAVLMLLGLSDLTASGLPEGPFSEYWSGQAGVRVAFFFGVTGLSFLLGPSSGGVRGSGWDGLKNRIVFSWGFLEMMVWFWVSF